VLTDAQFKQATWAYVHDTGTATSTWGDIGDWDTSGVDDFSYAFSKHRNKAGGSYVKDGNPNAATFVGTAISKWNTASATTLRSTFFGASEMNADLIGWKVAKVTSLANTFRNASKFVGTAISQWNTASFTSLEGTFWGSKMMNADLTGWRVEKVTSNAFADAFLNAPSLTACSKRKIADAWIKSSATFVATSYNTDWADEKCVKVRDYNRNFEGSFCRRGVFSCKTSVCRFCNYIHNGETCVRETAYLRMPTTKHSL
jgi:hypothetical protein